MPAPRIAIVAGEASGDLLGAGLVRALRERFPGAQIAGIGGHAMETAGLEAWWPSETLSVMGLVEVLKHLPELLKLRRELVERTIAWRPDVYVGIDSPDFNLGVERKLKLAGIRTVHYVSPSVWAWRESRAARMGLSTNLVLCLFPFEPEIYHRHSVDARYVGHPLAEAFAPRPDRSAARRALELPDGARVLALLPGSRRSEIARIGEPFALAAKHVAHALPGLRVVAPMATRACRDAFEEVLQRTGMRGHVEVLDGRAHDALVASDVVLVASGTATLEAMLAKRPMVVGYRLNALTYFIVKAFGLMKVSRYSLPNALAQEDLVPELMQERCKPALLADAVLKYFREPALAEQLLPKYVKLHALLKKDASREAAAAIAALMDSPSPAPQAK